MKKLSEKFWVGKHEVVGLLVHSATKCRLDTITILESWYGEDWFMDEKFSIILCEMVEVDISTGERK